MHSAMHRCDPQPGNNCNGGDSYNNSMYYASGCHVNSHQHSRSMHQPAVQCSWHHAVVWRIQPDNKQGIPSLSSSQVFWISLPKQPLLWLSITLQIDKHDKHDKLENWWGKCLGEKDSRPCQSWNIIGGTSCFLQGARWHSDAVLPAFNSHHQWRGSPCSHSFDLFWLHLLCPAGQQGREDSPQKDGHTQSGFFENIACHPRCMCAQCCSPVTKVVTLFFHHLFH